MKVIHNANLEARPLCGVPKGNISTTGVMVTCPKCIDLNKPLDRAAAMKQIEEAAKRFRANASTDL